jgi:hypothetical protein
MPRFDGTSIKLGDKDFIIPPLSLGQIKKFYPIIQEMEKGADILGKFNSVITIIHAALSRNYPDLKIEEVEDLIDLGNFKGTIDAVMSVSGFKLGEAILGNVQTGTASTPT